MNNNEKPFSKAKFENESKNENSFNICIKNEGFTELLLACWIVEKEPDFSVCIIDSEILPCGKLAKEPGFGTRFSLSKFIDQCERIGVGRSISRLREQVSSFSHLLKELNLESGVAGNFGSYEIVTEANIGLLDKVCQYNNILYDLFKINIFEIRTEKIREFGLNEDVVKALIFSNLECQINMGKILNTLISRFQKLGGRYISGCEIINYKQHPNNDSQNHLLRDSNAQVEILIKAKLDNNKFERLYCNKYICSKNAQSIHKCLLVTQPINNISFGGSFYFNNSNIFIRTVGNRILIEIQLEDSKRENEENQERLIGFLRRIFSSFEISPDVFWRIDNCQFGDKMCKDSEPSIGDSVFQIEKDGSTGINEDIRLSRVMLNVLVGRKAKL
jgi:hypothetical protein